MAYAFFKIGGTSVAEGEADELNKFLRTHRILSIDKHFVERVDGVHWYFCVEYLDAAPGKRAVSSEPGGKGSSSTRVDYKKILSEKDFEIFLALRALRKELAEKEKVPVYTVFTNDQLAQMVQGKVVSKRISMLENSVMQTTFVVLWLRNHAEARGRGENWTRLPEQSLTRR